MPFFKRTKPSSISSSSRPAETTEEIMQRRARDFIRTLQNNYPYEFEKLLSEVKNNDSSQARLTLRGLSSVVDEGYIDPILQELQAQITSA